jgi:hypothetical protein
MRLGSLLALALLGCPPPHPAPVPPDATDAAPAPAGDALPPTTPCQAACATLTLLGCPEGLPSDCVTVLAHIEGARAKRTPSGAPVTCAGVASATTVAQVRAAGVACGQ